MVPLLLEGYPTLPNAKKPTPLLERIVPLFVRILSNALTAVPSAVTDPEFMKVKFGPALTAPPLPVTEMLPELTRNRKPGDPVVMANPELTVELIKPLFVKDSEPGVLNQS